MKQNLTSKQLWDNEWKGFEHNQKNSLKNFFKNIFGPNIFRKKHEEVFWQLAQKYLPQKKKIKIIEIGCAPAALLVEFKNRFKYEIFGVEYSKSGYQISKSRFLGADIQQENLIYDDFFSNDFQKKYRGEFDIVYSRGFIEHFSSPRKAIELHLNLLKKNGVLFITIPNFSSLNGKVLSFFNRKLLDKHNTEIMNLEQFKQSFPDNLKVLFCNYFSHFDFFYFSADKRWKNILLLILQSGQFLAERTVWKILKPSYNNKFCSQLGFIGVKKK